MMNMNNFSKKTNALRKGFCAFLAAVLFAYPVVGSAKHHKDKDKDKESATAAAEETSPSDPAIARVQDYLQNTQMQGAYFKQTWPNGVEGNGILDYHAGYLDMNFAMPHRMEFKAHGNSAVYTDELHHSKTHLGLSHKPLGILMQNPLHLSGAVDVLNVQRDVDLVRITLARKGHVPDGTVTLTFHDTAGTLALYEVALTDSHNKLLLIQLTPK